MKKVSSKTAAISLMLGLLMVENSFGDSNQAQVTPAPTTMMQNPQMLYGTLSPSYTNPMYSNYGQPQNNLQQSIMGGSEMMQSLMAALQQAGNALSAKSQAKKQKEAQEEAQRKQAFMQYLQNYLNIMVQSWDEAPKNAERLLQILEESKQRDEKRRQREKERLTKAAEDRQARAERDEEWRKTIPPGANGGIKQQTYSHCVVRVSGSVVGGYAVGGSPGTHYSALSGASGETDLAVPTNNSHALATILGDVEDIEAAAIRKVNSKESDGVKKEARGFNPFM